jgi:phenylacetate-CoA ligase
VGEAFKDDSRVIEANAFVELEPYRGQDNVFQILVTTRGRRAMPLLRYRTGDIVRRMPDGAFRLLGREAGLHFRRDGSLVSPTEIDAVMPDDFTCWHYSLVQTKADRWDFHYVAEHTLPAGLTDRLAAVLGDEARVVAFRRRHILPAASGKFSLLKPAAPLAPKS